MKKQDLLELIFECTSTPKETEVSKQLLPKLNPETTERKSAFQLFINLLRPRSIRAIGKRKFFKPTEPLLQAALKKLNINQNSGPAAWIFSEIKEYRHQLHELPSNLEIFGGFLKEEDPIRYCLIDFYGISGKKFSDYGLDYLRVITDLAERLESYCPKPNEELVKYTRALRMLYKYAPIPTLDEQTAREAAARAIEEKQHSGRRGHGLESSTADIYLHILIDYILSKTTDFRTYEGSPHEKHAIAQLASSGTPPSASFEDDAEDQILNGADITETVIIEPPEKPPLGLPEREEDRTPLGRSLARHHAKSHQAAGLRENKTPPPWENPIDRIASIFSFLLFPPQFSRVSFLPNLSLGALRFFRYLEIVLGIPRENLLTTKLGTFDEATEKMAAFSEEEDKIFSFPLHFDPEKWYLIRTNPIMYQGKREKSDFGSYLPIVEVYSLPILKWDFLSSYIKDLRDLLGKDYCGPLFKFQTPVLQEVRDLTLPDLDDFDARLKKECGFDPTALNFSQIAYSRATRLYGIARDSATYITGYLDFSNRSQNAYLIEFGPNTASDSETLQQRYFAHDILEEIKEMEKHGFVSTAGKAMPTYEKVSYSIRPHWTGSRFVILKDGRNLDLEPIHSYLDALESASQSTSGAESHNLCSVYHNETAKLLGGGPRSQELSPVTKNDVLWEGVENFLLINKPKLGGGLAIRRVNHIPKLLGQICKQQWINLVNIYRELGLGLPTANTPLFTVISEDGLPHPISDDFRRTLLSKCNIKFPKADALRHTINVLAANNGVDWPDRIATLGQWMIDTLDKFSLQIYGRSSKKFQAFVEREVIAKLRVRPLPYQKGEQK